MNKSIVAIRHPPTSCFIWKLVNDWSIVMISIFANASRLVGDSVETPTVTSIEEESHRCSLHHFLQHPSQSLSCDRLGSFSKLRVLVCLECDVGCQEAFVLFLLHFIPPMGPVTTHIDHNNTALLRDGVECLHDAVSCCHGPQQTPNIRESKHMPQDHLHADSIVERPLEVRDRLSMLICGPYNQDVFLRVQL